MSYRLRPGLSFCRRDGHTIFLDVVADRFFEVTTTLATALDRVTEAKAGAAARVLAEQGLIVPNEAAGGPIAPFAWLPAEASRMEGTQAVRLRGLDLPIVGCGLLKSAIALRLVPFKSILDRLTQRRARLAVKVDQTRIQALADRFLAARRLLPLAPVCLRDSLALLEFLAFHGQAADLVIGVEAAPFSAHCWVQSETCVLNETLHQARRHTPILAV